jgi:hypothetical protein
LGVDKVQQEVVDDDHNFVVDTDDANEHILEEYVPNDLQDKNNKFQEI